MSTSNPPNFVSNAAAAIPVWLASNPNLAATGLPVSLQKTAAVTAAQVSTTSVPLANGAVFSAPVSNTAAIYIGGVGVLTTTGYKLTAGQSTPLLPVANLNQVYFIGANTSDIITAVGV